MSMIKNDGESSERVLAASGLQRSRWICSAVLAEFHCRFHRRSVDCKVEGTASESKKLANKSETTERTPCVPAA